MKLQIPSPCSENWNNMTPASDLKFGESSTLRHCLSCKKNIQDFTNKSDKEIIDYIKNSNGKICGKFDSSQLNRKLIYTYKFSFRYSRMAAGVVGFFSLLGSTFSQENKKVKDDSGKEFVLQNKNKPDSVFVQPEFFTFKGTVKDGTNSEPLPFVTVLLKGTKQGAVSDFDGNFSFKIPADSLQDSFRLQFTYVGYMRHEIIFHKTHIMGQEENLREVNLSLNMETQMLGFMIYEPKKPQNLFQRIFRNKRD